MANDFFDFVTPRLAVGGAIKDAEDVKTLLSAGITHVLDLQVELIDAPGLFARSPLVFSWNGVPDDGDPATHGDAWFAASLEFALPIFAMPGKKLFCHCLKGEARGPSTAFAVMLALGWTSEAAEALIRSARPQVSLRYQPEAEASVPSLGYF